MIPRRLYDYFFLDSDLKILGATDSGEQHDADRRTIGNYFETYEQAEFAKQALEAVYAYLHWTVKEMQAMPREQLEWPRDALNQAQQFITKEYYDAL